MRSFALSMLLLAASGSSLFAQSMGYLHPTPVKGRFYVSVDDGASIYVNGRQAHGTGIGLSRSGEVDLKVGDRVVVQLHNDGGPKHFFFLFASSDGKSVFSFKHSNFRIAPLDITDFTPSEIRAWSKPAKEIKGRPKFPVKSFSESMWGDLERTAIVTVITPEMESPTPQ
jgi:hypothetical protein